MAYDEDELKEFLRLSNRQEDIRRGSYRGKGPSKSVYDGPITIQDVVWDTATMPRHNQSDLVEAALSEEHPTAGGTYEGNVYYSNILPKGKDETPWSKRGSVLVKKAAQPNARKSAILNVENYFVDIGYMHESEVDGKKGKQLMGMIRRWNLNAGTSKEAMFDAMKGWKDRLFDGGDEEYEEDLREGGGDQGGY